MPRLDEPPVVPFKTWDVPPAPSKTGNEIGPGPIKVGPFTEIIVYSRSPKSKVKAKLIIGDEVGIGSACNIRAAGGVIEIGAKTMIGQGVEIVAANHSILRGRIYRDNAWDEMKTGVKIGVNCWVGAGSILLPGVTIGDNSIIAAGSVVNKSVPANEIWAGVPAHLMKQIT